MTSITYINELLTHHLQSALKWETLSNNSDTQNDERNYIKTVTTVILNMGGRIGSFAPSQQSKDIRDVLFPCVSKPITYECKKSKGNFILNDTIPKDDDDYYYIFINTKDLKISIKHCSSLISKNAILNESKYHIEELKLLYDKTMNLMEDAVNNGIMSYHEYGQLFKRTVSFPNGLKSRPRPNWSVKI